MLNYIITVAISAFFVPHYLGVFWEPLGESPGDILVGIGVVVLLGALNVVGVKEAAGLNVFLALADFVTQLLLVVRRRGAGARRRRRSSTTSTSAPTRRSSDFLIAIPVGMVAYTGIETISNMAEEARDYGKTIPRAMGGVVVAVIAIYAILPAVALSAMPVEDGETRWRCRGGGRFRRRSVLGVVENMDLGRSRRPRRSTSACSPPRSSSSRRTRA